MMTPKVQPDLARGWCARIDKLPGGREAYWERRPAMAGADGNPEDWVLLDMGYFDKGFSRGFRVPFESDVAQDYRIYHHRLFGRGLPPERVFPDEEELEAWDVFGDWLLAHGALGYAEVGHALHTFYGASNVYSGRGAAIRAVVLRFEWSLR